MLRNVLMHRCCYLIRNGLLIVSILFFSLNICFAQTSLLSELNLKKYYFVDEITVDLPKKQRVIQQEGLAYQFAVPYKLDFPVAYPSDSDLKKDFVRYFVELTATDANAINFSVTGLKQSDIIVVFVKNKETKMVYGPFFANDNDFDITAFPVFNTESILIEFIARNPIPPGKLKIAKAGFSYDQEYNGLSGDCNVDVNCNEGFIWQNVKRSVVKLVIDNGLLCTGTVMNNAAVDGKPYILTANHCISSPREAANTVFYFNYESHNCDDPASYYPDQNDYVMSGAELKATKFDYDGRLDFTLLLLNENIPDSYNPYFAGWSASEVPPEHTVCIHHPMGDVKKISVDYNVAVTASFSNEFDENSHWRILKWDVGVTEGGSSGSALFNQEYQVVGDLTGGDAACDYPYNDYYTKFNLAFDKYPDSTEQIKYWLDPEDIGIRELEGYPEKNVEINEDYVFFPNPADNVLYMKSSKLMYDVWVKIYNTTGGIAWRKYYSNLNQMLVLDVPANLKGLYVVEIVTYDGRIRKKVFFE